MEVKIIAKKTIKGKTNAGDFAKQRFLVIESDEYEQTLYIEKLVYQTPNKITEKNGYVVLKTFNGRTLYKKVFALKMSTVSELFNWLTSA